MDKVDAQHCATTFIGRMRANLLGDVETVDTYDRTFENITFVAGGVQLMVNMALIPTNGCASKAGGVIATVLTTRISDEMLIPACDVFREIVDVLTDAPCGEECAKLESFWINTEAMPCDDVHVLAVEEAVLGFVEAYTSDEIDDALARFNNAYLANSA